MALEVNQSLRQLIPDYDAIESLERRITPEEERKIDSLWLAVLRKWVEHQGFSEEGLRKISDHMAKEFSKSSILS